MQRFPSALPFGAHQRMSLRPDLALLNFAKAPDRAALRKALGEIGVSIVADDAVSTALEVRVRPRLSVRGVIARRAEVKRPRRRVNQSKTQIWISAAAGALLDHDRLARVLAQLALFWIGPAYEIEGSDVVVCPPPNRLAVRPNKTGEQDLQKFQAALDKVGVVIGKKRVARFFFAKPKDAKTTSYDLLFQLRGGDNRRATGARALVDAVELDAIPLYLPQAALIPAPATASPPPGYDSLLDWQLERMRVGFAWDLATGGGHIDTWIAIIDKGFDLSHPAFATAQKDRTVKSLVFNNGADDTLPPDPIESIGQAEITTGSSADDRHGTELAAAIMGDYLTDEVAGIAPGCSFALVRAFSVSSFDVAAALDTLTPPNVPTSYLTDETPQRPFPNTTGSRIIVVIPFSTGLASGSMMLAGAVTDAHAAGLLLLAPTGNDGNTTSIGYPASLPEIVPVGALAKLSDSDLADAALFWNEGLTLESNYDGTGSVVLAAPGQSVRLPVAGGTYSPNDSSVSGTSVAATLAAGVAALSWSVNTGFSRDQILEALRRSAQKVGGYTYSSDGAGLTKSNETGYGRVDALNAVHLADVFISSWTTDPTGTPTSDDGLEPTALPPLSYPDAVIVPNSVTVGSLAQLRANMEKGNCLDPTSASGAQKLYVRVQNRSDIDAAGVVVYASIVQNVPTPGYPTDVRPTLDADHIGLVPTTSATAGDPYDLGPLPANSDAIVEFSIPTGEAAKLSTDTALLIVEAYATNDYLYRDHADPLLNGGTPVSVSPLAHNNVIVHTLNRAAAVLSVAPAAVDFGNVVDGQQQFRKITIFNEFQTNCPEQYPLTVNLDFQGGSLARFKIVESGAPGTGGSLSLADTLGPIVVPPPPDAVTPSSVDVYVAYENVGGPTSPDDAVLRITNAVTSAVTQVDLTANPVSAEIAVMLVIDRSGSMQGPAATAIRKIDDAMTAASLFIDLLQAGDWVGLVGFNHAPGLQQGITLDGGGPAQGLLNAAVSGDPFYPAGSTSIGGGIRSALVSLDAATAAPTNQAVLVLTDGIENTNPMIPTIVADDASDATYSIAGKRYYGIGLGLAQRAETFDLVMTSSLGALSNQFVDGLDGTNRFQLHKMFVQVLSDMTATAIVEDPVYTAAPGETKETPLEVAPLEKAMDFIVINDTHQGMAVELERPDGVVVPGVGGSGPGLRIIRRATHTVFRYDLKSASLAAGKSLVGTWVVRVSNTAQDGDALRFTVLSRALGAVSLGGGVVSEFVKPGEAIDIILEPQAFGVPAAWSGTAFATVRRPNGSSAVVRLTRDTYGNYVGSFSNTRLEGVYVVDVQAKIAAPGGAVVKRYKRFTVSVARKRPTGYEGAGGPSGSPSGPGDSPSTPTDPGGSTPTDPGTSGSTVDRIREIVERYLRKKGLEHECGKCGHHHHHHGCGRCGHCRHHCCCGGGH